MHLPSQDDHCGALVRHLPQALLGKGVSDPTMETFSVAPVLTRCACVCLPHAAWSGNVPHLSGSLPVGIRKGSIFH